MKIEGEFQIIEIGRCADGRSDVVLSVAGTGNGVQLTITGIERDQCREIAALFQQRVRVAIEISRATP